MTSQFSNHTTETIVLSMIKFHQNLVKRKRQYNFYEKIFGVYIVVQFFVSSDEIQQLIEKKIHKTLKNQRGMKWQPFYRFAVKFRHWNDFWWNKVVAWMLICFAFYSCYTGCIKKRNPLEIGPIVIIWMVERAWAEIITYTCIKFDFLVFTLPWV